MPAADRRTLAALGRLGIDAPPPVRPTTRSGAARGGRPAPSALARLQQHLFAIDSPPAGAIDESVSLFSAPGEGARRWRPRAGCWPRRTAACPSTRSPFSCAPHTYFGLLEHALARAGVPAWFERGTRRPDPAGRAFLALLACADEHLSARRFAEYLSLGQVPVAALRAQPIGAEPPAETWSPPTDDLSSGLVRAEDRSEDPEPAMEAAPPTERDGSRIVAGTLRAPWRWEELLVEAYVIQGLDRWKRRLKGLAHEYDLRLRELHDEDADSPRVAAVIRDREELTHLEDFALPVVTTLDGWRSPRLWGEWLTVFEALCRVSRKPARVLRVLTELAPLSASGRSRWRGPRRSRRGCSPSPTNRRGVARIGVRRLPASARGRRFRVVFVPGLAERLPAAAARGRPAAGPPPAGAGRLAARSPTPGPTTSACSFAWRWARRASESICPIRASRSATASARAVVLRA